MRLGPERDTRTEWRSATLPRMCNDYEQHVTWAGYRAAIRQLELVLPVSQSAHPLRTVWAPAPA
jgi:hypothetical protein